MGCRSGIFLALALALLGCSSDDAPQSPTTAVETTVAEATTTTQATTTTIDPRIVELETKVKELEAKLATISTAPKAAAKPAGTSPPETSPATTPKPVYLTRTEVRTVAKIVPNGPWTCSRTYIYSDGKRTSETFSSPTECRQ